MLSGRAGAIGARLGRLTATRVRAQAMGFIYSRRRLSAIFSGFLTGIFLRDFSVTRDFVSFAICRPAVMPSFGFFGPRTRGLALEAFSRETESRSLCEPTLP